MSWKAQGWLQIALNTVAAVVYLLIYAYGNPTAILVVGAAFHLFIAMLVVFTLRDHAAWRP